MNKRRKGAAKLMFSMLIFIGSIVGLLSIIGLSYTANSTATIYGGSNNAVANQNNNFQISKPSENVTGSGCTANNAFNNALNHGILNGGLSCKQENGGVFQQLVAGDPLTVAITIGTIFIALGLLAGILGAGMLANVMARVGVTLGVLSYINGVISDLFGAVPLALIAMVNVVLIAASIVLISESL